MSNRVIRALIWGTGLVAFLSVPAARTALSRPSGGADDREIIFDSWMNGQEIWAVKADGSGLRALTHSPEGSHNLAPDWSPDGRRIAFSSTRHAPVPGLAQDPSQGMEAQDIYVMNADGSALRRLTFSGEPNESPDWSPDGKRIAFVSSRDGNPKVYLMDPDGSRIQRLTGEQITPRNKTEVQPAWSPDGRRIAFSSNRDGGFEIYVLA